MKFIVGIIFSCFFLSTSIHGQGVNDTKYSIVDEISLEPIPFATIVSQNPNIITTSDHQGFFKFDFGDLDALQISISYVGYKTKEVTIHKGHAQVITLATYTQMLDTVEVKVKEPSKKDMKYAQNILEAAFSDLKKQSRGFIAEGDYSHRIIENGQFVKLKDASISFRDKEGYGNIQKSPKKQSEEITFQELRSSLDHSVQEMVFFTNNFSFYIEEFNFLLHNGLKYAKHDWVGNAVYLLKDSVRDGSMIRYKISLDLSQQRSDTLFGDFFVLADMTFDISFDETSNRYTTHSMRKNYLSTRKKGLLIHKENNFFRIDLIVDEKNSLPEKIQHHLSQYIISGEDTTKIESSHYLTFHKWITDPKELKNNQFKSQLEYHKDFWLKYPHSSKEINDMGGWKSLEKEFQIQHDQKASDQRQEQLKLEKIQQLINGKSQKGIYLIFWKDIQDIRDLYTKTPYLIPLDKISPIFIYTGQNLNQNSWRRDCWTSDLMYFPNFYLSTSYMDLLEENMKPPVFKIIFPDGKSKVAESLHSF